MNRVFIFLLLTALAVMGFMGRVPLNYPETEAFTIGGIGLGTSADDVESKLGAAKEIVPDVYTCTRQNSCETWVYDASSVFFVDGEVVGFSTSDQALCLLDEICTGDPVKKVLKRLGKTEIVAASQDKPSRLEYLSSVEDACWLWVFLNSEQTNVEAFRLACEP